MSLEAQLDDQLRTIAAQLQIGLDGRPLSRSLAMSAFFLKAWTIRVSGSLTTFPLDSRRTMHGRGSVSS